MKLKLLASLLVIAFLALPLSGCNKEPAPKAVCVQGPYRHEF